MGNSRQLVKNGFYWAQRKTARAITRYVPRKPSRNKFVIFALHTIADVQSDMAVSPNRFRSQLKTLHQGGYRCLDLVEMISTVNEGRPLEQPSFALTFDDGYKSVYDEALPILKEFGMSATVFLTVNFLDKIVSPPWHSEDPALVFEYAKFAECFQPLEWHQAQELADSSQIQIGSHSLNHYLMGQLDQESLNSEFVKSRSVLENRLGVDVNVFAYPFGVRRYGAYSDSTEKALRDAGYTASFTSEIGRASTGGGAFLMPRISLVEEDSDVDVVAKAAGAYDWVGMAQSAFQNIFSNPHGSST